MGAIQSGCELWISPLLSPAVPVLLLPVLNHTQAPASCVHRVWGQDGVLAPSSSPRWRHLLLS